MSNIKQKIKLTHTNLVLYENCILEITLDDNFFYTILEAKEINAAMVDLVKYGKMRVVLVAGDYSDCDSETRKYIASDEIGSKIIALALLTKSLAQDLLGNFIIEYDKPPTPTKLFRSKEKAVMWLMKHKF
jgi:hypothetical protein